MQLLTFIFRLPDLRLVYPVLEAPGYKIQYIFPSYTKNSVLFDGSSMDDRTLVTFSDNPTSLLEAYVGSGEGIDWAGSFTVQVG